MCKIHNTHTKRQAIECAEREYAKHPTKASDAYQLAPLVAPKSYRLDPVYVNTKPAYKESLTTKVLRVVTLAFIWAR